VAELIREDGIREEVMPENGQNFSLAELYKHLGCNMVQVIYLNDGKTMWLDEEGKFKTHERNEKATVLLEEAGGGYGDYVAGSALICDEHEVQ
jgi:hypothetical protein